MLEWKVTHVELEKTRGLQIEHDDCQIETCNTMFQIFCKLAQIFIKTLQMALYLQEITIQSGTYIQVNMKESIKS